MKTFLHLTLLTAIATVLAGCATTAYISSETDPRYTIAKNDPIHVLIPDQSTIAERTVAGIVEDEIRKDGFNVVPRDHAEYILLISLDEKTSRISGSLPLTQTARTSGSVGTTPYSGSTTYTTWMPYSYNYRVKKLYASLYAVRDIKKEKIMSVWEGYIGAEDKEFDRYTRSLIHEMLKHFGGSYGAHTPIDWTYK
jgi:hypothetical protein